MPHCRLGRELAYTNVYAIWQHQTSLTVRHLTSISYSMAYFTKTDLQEAERNGVMMMAQKRLYNTLNKMSSLHHLPRREDIFHGTLAHGCDHGLRILVNSASQVATKQWASTDTRQHTHFISLFCWISNLYQIQCSWLWMIDQFFKIISPPVSLIPICQNIASNQFAIQMLLMEQNSLIRDHRWARIQKNTKPWGILFFTVDYWCKYQTQVSCTSIKPYPDLKPPTVPQNQACVTRAQT